MRAVLAALLVVLLTGDALASKSCPTRAEAKEMFGQNTYLYWHRDAGGNRCWANRRTRSESARGRGLPPRYRERVVANDHATPPPIPAPPPPSPPSPSLTYLPAELMPQPHRDREFNVLDGPRWAWVHDARAAAHDADLDTEKQRPPTLDGRDPDVWPTLAKNEPTPSQTTIAGLMATLLAGMLFGLLLGRLHWHRLRIRR